MLERDRRTLERLHRTEIAGSLVPEVTLIKDLLKYLNKGGTPESKTILGILEDMLEIEAMAQPVQGILLPALSLRKTDPDKFDLLCRIDTKVAALQKRLKEFRFIPRAEAAVGGGGGSVEWAVWWSQGKIHAREATQRMHAAKALEVILKLTSIGELARLRRCAHCGTWLYARFRHQNFCSVKCQQKHYTDTDQWRSHRRNYMRRYYREHLSTTKK